MYPTIVNGIPDFKKSLTVNVSVPYASMFWGALTGNKNPKLITNCCINTNPIDWSPKCNVDVSEIKTGINAEDKLVALANPKCIKILNNVMSAIVAIIGNPLSPINPNVWSLNHCAAPVFNNTLPNEIPTPNTIIVPQGIFFSTPFQVITPTLGINIIPNAINVIENFPYASQTNATDVGDLTVVRHSAGGISSETHGYAAGGHSYHGGGPTDHNVIDRVSFATGGNATDHGDLSELKIHLAGVASSTHGYTVGGLVGSGIETTVLSTIDKFAFAANVTATDVGDILVAADGMTGHQFWGITNGNTKNRW